MERLIPAIRIVGGPVSILFSVLVLGQVVATAEAPGLLRMGILCVALIPLWFYPTQRLRWPISVSVLALALALLFYRLGGGSLYDWDEAIYAQIAREMQLSDTWTTLTWNGAPFLNKPPLYFWLTALTYRLIGLSELSARLWPAIFGFGVVVLTFTLGVRIHSWIVGVIAVLLLLVVDWDFYGHWWNFLSLSRVGMLDSTLMFWIMLALLLAWEGRSRPSLIRFIGLPVGMAVMTKSWPGFLGAAIPVVYWLIEGERQWRTVAYWFYAALLAIIVLGPWPIWQYILHGPAFWNEFVGINLTGRFFQSFEGHTAGPFFYLDIVQRGFSVWGYLWPLAYSWAVWQALAKGDRRAWLLLVWITLPLLLFSMAQTKLAWYIIIIYPGIALLLGMALAELLSERFALGLTAALMIAFCLRLPIPANGSRDVKQFALQAAQSIASVEPIYVVEQACTLSPQMLPSNIPPIPDWHIRPSLRFYLARPLICIEELAIQAGVHPRHAYFISPQASWSHIGHRARIILEGHNFVLARWE